MYRCFYRTLHSILTLVLILALNVPAFAAANSVGNQEESRECESVTYPQETSIELYSSEQFITARQWAAMLCEAYPSEEAGEELPCLTEAFRRGWLSVSMMTAPDLYMCRGALYQSAFAAAGLSLYDYSLYPGGESLSVYDNCLRVGAELGLCPPNAEPLELMTGEESAALLRMLLTQELEVEAPPMLDELPIQNDAGVNMNDYLLKLRQVPGPVLQAFEDMGWIYTVNFPYLAQLSEQSGANCTGATDYSAKRIYVSEAGPTLHEFGHFLDYILQRPSESENLFEREASAASAFLREYALTNSREYFAEYFAYYLTHSDHEEKVEQMRQLTPETFAYFSALSEAGWNIQA